MLLDCFAQLHLGDIRLRQADIENLALHHIEVINAMQESSRHVTDVYVVTFEMRLIENHETIINSAVGEIVDQQVDTHTRRHAEHGCEAITNGVRMTH